MARANESLVDTGMGTGAERGYKNTGSKGIYVSQDKRMISGFRRGVNEICVEW